MTEMVERVAKSLAELDHGEGIWDAELHKTIQTCLPDAGPLRH